LLLSLSLTLGWLGLVSLTSDTIRFASYTFGEGEASFYKESYFKERECEEKMGGANVTAIDEGWMEVNPRLACRERRVAKSYLHPLHGNFSLPVLPTISLTDSHVRGWLAPHRCS